MAHRQEGNHAGTAAYKSGLFRNDKDLTVLTNTSREESRRTNRPRVSDNKETSQAERLTRIRYNIAARLKPKGNRHMAHVTVSYLTKKNTTEHLVITPRLMACIISVFTRLSVLLNNSARARSTRADDTYDRKPVRLPCNR